ncbi:unnamed protein product [Didymodactylos carnosus]|uniref:Uncharacterized protein n=1 Tax=Didymodactylos carnosus TaxID=1234261 RepID=A0A814WS75_9BILA|nr:unnamed protein product [Didymodactylos carnosus]CAF3973636.1 unnamed protein product [Didymodactylos carnosus]
MDTSGGSLVSLMAIGEQLVQIKARTAPDCSVATVQSTLAHSLLAIQRTTAGNEFVSGLFTNFYTHFYNNPP